MRWLCYIQEVNGWLRKLRVIIDSVFTMARPIVEFCYPLLIPRVLATVTLH